MAVSSGHTTYVNFQLERCPPLKGQITDASNGQPLVGAAVNAYQGDVSIASDLPAGTYSLNAGKAAYLDQGKTGIAVTAGATTYVNFNLQPQ